MAIRVAQIGTGNVGRHALTQLITDPRFELAGVWVSSESKADKDAAELAGLDNSTGITATSDLDAILTDSPECAVYTAMADNRLPDALEDYRRILAAGINVVGKPAVVLEHVTRLRDDLCPEWPQPAQEGGSYRVEVAGEPSYALDLCLSSPNGDHNHAGLVATAARVVNAIPAVVAAPPGIRTTLDLPLITGKGLYAR
jgi:hypothetical protein